MPRRLDWIIFELRWLLIAGAVVVLALGPTGGDTEGVVSIDWASAAIIAALLYNLLVGILLLLGVSSRIVRQFTLVGDSVLTAVLFAASDGSALLLVSLGLFPVITASLGAGRTQALIATLLIGLGSGLYILATMTLSARGSALLEGLLFLSLTAILASSLGKAIRPATPRSLTTTEQEIESTRLRAERERVRGIYEMASTLSANLDYEKVLDAALDVGVLGLRDMGQAVRLIGMVLMYRNDERKELIVVTSRRLTRSDEQVTLQGLRGVLGLALKQTEPVFANDATRDPELNRFVGFQTCHSILAIPLRASFENYGVLVYGLEQEDAFSDDHIELLSAIGIQATIALQNAVLFQKIQREKERIVEVEEDARKKLARDLHDGPTQVVSAIAMRINYIRKLIEKGQPQTVGDELQKVEEMARDTTKDIRHMLFTLRPLVLETQGLVAALKQFVDKMKETHKLEVILQAQPQVDTVLDTHAQGVLFYIVEEAVNNARKHAKAEHIYVRLYRRDNQFVTEVQDDGVGFDTAAVSSGYDKRGSLGMINMRERAELVNGRLTLESAVGQGTKITVTLTVHEPAPVPGSGGGAPQLRETTNPKRPVGLNSALRSGTSK
ncbi:MAG TPA: GAF domain-containing sensor histidine kinase [Aggregatilineales bacterium]|nr:GAF domain-containing sensor histidine kinase [Aggregatilineales bacterium]